MTNLLKKGRTMSRTRKIGVSNGVIAFLLVVMLVLASLITWLGVPMIAQNTFGAPADYLTKVQRWSYSLQVLMAKDDLLTPACTLPQTMNFTVESGSSVNQIVNNLESSGVIRSASGLRSYLIYKGLDTQLLAGDYRLDCSATAVEVANSIRNIYQEEVIFVILPGWRAEEIAAALLSSGIQVSPEEFMGVVQNPGDLRLPDYFPMGKSVEGFLFPGEYLIKRDISAQSLVQTFIDRFNQEVPPEEMQAVSAHGITPYEAVILASIVQRETFAEDERPLMASVFFNRLDLGMRLETDPTVQYALGYGSNWGWWKSPLEGNDLNIQSEYNTYLINGLPPAPIANPDAASIRAVLSPAQSDYLYFRAKCDGSGYHVFSVTYEEHVSNACN
jgi:UPF0755 protein